MNSESVQWIQRSLKTSYGHYVAHEQLKLEDDLKGYNKLCKRRHRIRCISYEHYRVTRILNKRAYESEPIRKTLEIITYH